ncbi:MAG TPA: erythromycin esterase family protein [Longimicrobium sp.]
MEMGEERRVVEAARRGATALGGGAGDYDRLMEMVGDARVVCLGEASHGTHEFYRERARITRRLVEEKGFTIMAVEADWPDAYRVNRWVRGASEDVDAEQALGGFTRFPGWMWRNRDVVDLVTWLRGWNDALPAGRVKTGFYGLDLYSMFASIEAVVRYLDQVDPEAARRARARYACFGRYAGDSQAYGYAAEVGVTPGCRDQAVAQLVELQRRAADLARRDGHIPEDELFYAEQNARLVANAEAYYRTMFAPPAEGWNLRDTHMADTLEALLERFGRGGRPAKAVVWAHNSHLGDARATEPGDEGELNVGQLARERWGGGAVLVGFSTYTGTVTAASDWDEPGQRKRVRPALPGSWEALLHEAGGDFVLPLRGSADADVFRERRLERAIGVVYLPRSERASHYFHARLADQFDAVIHVDTTRAVEPLEPSDVWHRGEEAPETYPYAV